MPRIARFWDALPGFGHPRRNVTSRRRTFCVCRLFRHVLAAGVETLFIPFSYAGMAGIRHGLRKTRIAVRAACVMAVTITVLMISAWTSKALWIFDWALIWPAWYVLAIAWRQAGQAGRTGPFAGQGEATVRV